MIITQELWDKFKTVENGQVANAVSILLNGEKNIISKTVIDICKKVDDEMPGHNIGLVMMLQFLELSYTDKGQDQ